MIQEPTCAMCGEEYCLRSNCEPTKYCDVCAHIAAEAAERERDELRAELDLECSKCLFILSSGITQDGCCGCTIAKLRVEFERLKSVLKSVATKRQFGLCWCQTADGIWCVGQPQCKAAIEAAK